MKWALTIGLIMALCACTSVPTPAERKLAADTLVAAHGWHATRLVAGQFELMAYLPAQPVSVERLTIYIEGDGFAWINASQPSFDPTPRDPLALRLALAQPDGAAAYLARPCQYVDAEISHCDRRYWTDARFAAEVIASTDVAIDALKQRFLAQHITLVGYSGGGAVAALVAARRRDVDQLITVAGNLNPMAWAALHHLSPLTESLNPADYVAALQGIAQWHWVGGRDTNITPELSTAFADLFPARERPRVVIEPTFDHRCCWVEQWPTLWSQRFHLPASVNGAHSTKKNDAKPTL